MAIFQLQTVGLHKKMATFYAINRVLRCESAITNQIRLIMTGFYTQ